MRVAGLGFRAAATVEDLMAALALAGKADVLATDIRKADAAVMAALAARTGLAVRAVDVSGTETRRWSRRGAMRVWWWGGSWPRTGWRQPR